MIYLEYNSNNLNKLVIEGGSPLSGEVTISGSKNSALAIIAASILSSDGPVKLKNVPVVSDVSVLFRILESLGVIVSAYENFAIIDSTNGLITNSVNHDYSKKIRASILLAGPILARTGEVTVAYPGGCVIGPRPIDLHVWGFQQLGAKVERIQPGYLRISSNGLKGALINLPFPSVGATENLVIAASLADGETIINNAAREPEIVDLANFLNAMGASIQGAGFSTIKINGVKKLKKNEYKIMPDRIEAGTFILASAITNGQVELKNISPEYLGEFLKVVERIGIKVIKNEKSILISGRETIRSVNVITQPYPGFPTDLHPLLSSLLSLSNGVSIITEEVFPQRFSYVNELCKMGANIKIVGNSAIIKGVDCMFGAEVSATDLRGGAALILSGLIAKGVTNVNDCSLIYRGYEKITEKLTNLGANIYSINPK